MVDTESTCHNVEAGNWAVADWSSRSVPIPCAPWWPDWSSGVAEPRPRLFIRRKGGGRRPSILWRSSPRLDSFLPFIMARGRAGASTVATRVSTRQRAPPSQEHVAAEPATRGRGRGRGQGRRGARGRGGRGGAPASPPPAVPPPMEGHVGDQTREFVIRLHRPVRRRLCLPTPFAREMELDPPQALRLHMRGCENGSMRVDVDFPAPHVMYLRRGWKTFARAHSLSEGLVLYFKLMENGLLSVKVFGDLGTRLKCCVESSSDHEDSSSSGSDEEGIDSDDESVERGHIDLVSD